MWTKPCNNTKPMKLYHHYESIITQQNQSNLDKLKTRYFYQFKKLTPTIAMTETIPAKPKAATPFSLLKNFFIEHPSLLVLSNFKSELVL